MNEQIDWSKAPAGTTGAMRANFDSTASGGKTWIGKVEWLPIDGDFKDYAQGSDAWEYFAKPATPTWNGPEDGLPPVGTVCELRTRNGGWGEAEIKYHGRAVCVWLWVRRDGNTEQVEHAESPDRLEFRPIRTAEQLAAEEHRAKYMPQLMKLWDADTQLTNFLEAVYALIVEAGKP